MAACAPLPASSLKSPPRKDVDADIAEQHVGIGHGRLGAAAAVAGRARHSARAARTDMQQAERLRDAMEPPPAPISIIWIDWILSGKPLPLRKRS